jgi:hypothetical protein
MSSQRIDGGASLLFAAGASVGGFVFLVSAIGSLAVDATKVRASLCPRIAMEPAREARMEGGIVGGICDVGNGACVGIGPAPRPVEVSPMPHRPLSIVACVLAIACAPFVSGCATEEEELVSSSEAQLREGEQATVDTDTGVYIIALRIRFITGEFLLRFFSFFGVFLFHMLYKKV